MPTPPARTGLRVARRVATVLTACVAAMVLLVSGTGYGLLVWSDSAIERVDAFAGLEERPARSAAGSTTFLLVGTDGREGMTRKELRRLHLGNTTTAPGRRADTTLLVHVSPRHDTITVVSLPRDSYVTIPTHRAADGTRVRAHRSKLNSAYAAGGPGLTVATVERSTDLRVDHYIELDFLGFVRLVDALGGVEVCTPTRLRDRKAGLRLPAGVSQVDGRKGLAFVRARSIDARADLGRVERQQQFLGAMAHRVTSTDVLLDPRTLVRFMDAALGAVRTDTALQRDELVGLATDLRHVSGGNVRFQTVPIANPSLRTGVGAVALWDRQAAEELFIGMREDRAPERRRPPRRSSVTVPPGQVSVQVYNGAGVDGLGARATADLQGRGFAVAGPARDWRSTGGTRTVIRYDAEFTESIKTVSASLPGARLVPVPGLGRTMQVVVGSSYDGARAVKVVAAGGAQGTAPTTKARTADDGPCD